MKKLSVIYLLAMLVIFPTAIYSQSVTLSGGASLPIGNMENNFHSGGKGAIEFDYPIGKGFNAFVNASYTGLPVIDTFSTGQSYSVNGLLGIRYLFGNSFINVNADAGMGVYDFTVKADSNLVLVTDFSKVQYGFNAGTGVTISVTDLYGIVMLVRYNQIFSGQKFITTQFGIKFNL